MDCGELYASTNTGVAYMPQLSAGNLESIVLQVSSRLNTMSPAHYVH